ncbi:hypothetical protein MAUB1S_09672 [Mycolicibacterium aubagnense]
MNAHPRQSAFKVPTVPSFIQDGTVVDLVNITPADIDFAAMAAGLAKIVRFNGSFRGLAYSDAQHCVMGADAMMNETGDQVLAGYFLLHDGHEYLLGDWSKPSVDAILHHLLAYVGKDDKTAGLKQFIREAYRRAISDAKAHIDRAIFAAARIPNLASMPATVAQVKDMDTRMLRAEALALYGQNAARHLPAADRPAPKLDASIKPWGAMKAEEAFIDRLQRYLGIRTRLA